MCLIDNHSFNSHSVEAGSTPPGPHAHRLVAGARTLIAASERVCKNRNLLSDSFKSSQTPVQFQRLFSPLLFRPRQRCIFLHARSVCGTAPTGAQGVIREQAASPSSVNSGELRHRFHRTPPKRPSVLKFLDSACCFENWVGNLRCSPRG